MKYGLKTFIIFFLFQLWGIVVYSQPVLLDDFELSKGWNFIQSDGVELQLTTDKGVSGEAARFDYNFVKGTGYGGIQKLFPVDLPENFEFSFWVKADSPANNFEIKFIDSTGNNVWWVSNRNYTFPTEWTRIRIKKRHISFAWGPTNDQSMKRIDRIEFTIASFVGGKGTVWIDDLKFEALPPETDTYPTPVITASSSVNEHQALLMNDQNNTTFWQSKTNSEQSVIIDCKVRREFGGLQINWLAEHYATKYDISLSNDGKNWEKLYSVPVNSANISFIRLAEAEANFIKLNFAANKNNKAVGISEIILLGIKQSLSPNDFLIYAAKNSPEGDYPRSFLEQASYWTISGVNNDVKEAMINEDGMVEVDKAKFSIEPVIKFNNTVYNWSNVSSSQSLGNSNGFSFTPTVDWHFADLQLTTSICSSGEANKNSKLDIRYYLTNNSSQAVDFEFYLLVRPYQVNPYYQFLNLAGGVGKIRNIEQTASQVLKVDDKNILFHSPYHLFSASSFDEGNPVELIRNEKLPLSLSATDPNGMAGGIVKYNLHLAAGEKLPLFVTVPFHQMLNTAFEPSPAQVADDFAQTNEFWEKKTSHISFNLPPSADKIINTYRSNLVYVLMNRDKAGIQPGSRSYERSWIRDGALTSSALLKSGIVTEVKDFINWYSGYLYENGKVPCVVDSRGPDPVPENDSHGEMIYLIREYFNFTHDTAFLQSKNATVLKAVEYIETLVAQRSTDYFKNGNDSIHSLYGLVPESISHEGYSAKPMHSYWDNFFTIKGLKDAAEIQKILGNTTEYERIKKTRDTFSTNLYNSLKLAMKVRGINYIPGCAELGDFDATSTTIALTPCNELNNLPDPQVYNTFDKYYDFFKNRRDNKIEWVNYTPYENRLIGSFIILDEPERAHELIKYFLHDQRPQGWNHWAEVVWKDYRTPRYIGDMPHTWVGSDFLNAVRTMFVYENEWDQSLVLAPALYQDWIDAPEGMSVNNLPTYFGEISYSIKKAGNTYHFAITGDIKLPANGIKIKNFNGSKLPIKVVVNGKQVSGFKAGEIPVTVFPAEVEIYY